MTGKFTPLTTGSVEEILRGETVDCPIVVQILGSRRIANAGQGPDPKDRYRLLISDGKYIHTFAMLSTSLNTMYEAGELSDMSIIKIGRYVTSIVNKSDANERRVIILFELDVLHSGDEVGEKIGNPEIKDAKSFPSKTQASAVQKENMNGNGSSYGNNSNNRNNMYAKKTNEEPSQSMNSSTSGSLGDHLTLPIDSLSPYQNKWVIKARVTAKSAIRTWSNAKGEGKLFSMDLVDETGEIRATAFQQAVDKYYEMIEIDKIYYISKCQLKPANKQYSKLKNEYEMTFSNDTVVQECTDDNTSIPTVKYDLVNISTIANMEANEIVDVVGVCRDASDLSNITVRATGRELIKREITLVDQSNVCISLTLWGDEAKSFDGSLQPVVLVKSARVGEFGGGKTLGMISGSVLKLNPDIPEGHRLRGWFDNGGGENITTTLSTRATGNYSTEWLTFHETKVKNLGGGDKPDYFQTVAFIHNVRSGNSFYKACPTAECQKKVVDQDNGQYRCDKCNTDFPNFKYRLLMNVLIGDWTSNRWITVFSETAEQLLGKTAQEVGELLEHDKDAAEVVFNSITFKNKVFKLRTKVETYGDVPRNKITTQAITEINYKEYNNYLIKNLQKSTGIGKME